MNLNKQKGNHQAKRSRQRFIDRLTREQRRMPLMLKPMLTVAQARVLLAVRAKEVAIHQLTKQISEMKEAA